MSKFILLPSDEYIIIDNTKKPMKLCASKFPIFQSSIVFDPWNVRKLLDMCILFLDYTWCVCFPNRL